MSNRNQPTNQPTNFNRPQSSLIRKKSSDDDDVWNVISIQCRTQIFIRNTIFSHTKLPENHNIYHRGKFSASLTTAQIGANSGRSFWIIMNVIWQSQILIKTIKIILHWFNTPEILVGNHSDFIPIPPRDAKRNVLLITTPWDRISNHPEIRFVLDVNVLEAWEEGCHAPHCCLHLWAPCLPLFPQRGDPETGMIH